MPDRAVSVMQHRDAGAQAKFRWTLGRLPFPLKKAWFIKLNPFMTGLTHDDESSAV
jgi:hypothetical protein